jgi:Zn-dependent protease with chaperone function/predicted negative regulator of RcsB-dependent stress response
MTFFQPENWILQFFPQTGLIADSSGRLMISLLFFFAVFSLLYLAAMRLTAHSFPARRKGVGAYISTGYLVTIVLACLALAARANGSTYRPLYQAAAFIMFNLGVVFSLAGGWLVYRHEAEEPVPLGDFIRSGYWFSLLTSSLLWLVIFLAVPVVRPETHTVYWGPAALALLLYFALSRFFAHQGYRWLGLKVSPADLTGKQGVRFRQVEEFVAEIDTCPVVLLGRGFRNAVALYPQKHILLGQDLLSRLGQKEIQAIILHEIGHLRDTKYIVHRHRLGQVVPFVMLAWLVAHQSRIIANPLLNFAVLLAGFVAFSLTFKRLRLKGEFVADTFVKEYPGDLYPHLLTAIAKITRLNGMDKDHCKKHNHGHLDLDERREMVGHGTFAMKRRPVRRSILIFLLFMVLGALFQLGWSRIFPSSAKQWNTMHREYHLLVRQGDFTTAGKALDRAIAFSLQEFGETSSRSYLLFKDCADLRIQQHNIAKAEQCILRATRIGRELYGENSLERIRELRIHARILAKQGHKDEAVQIYQAMIDLQRKNGDSPDHINRTLDSLAALTRSRER